jgi:hypothetical protein
MYYPRQNPSLRRAIRRLKNFNKRAIVLDAMIARHKPAVCGRIGTYFAFSLPNPRNIVRVHVSYRAFLHGGAFHPNASAGAGLSCTTGSQQPMTANLP